MTHPSSSLSTLNQFLLQSKPNSNPPSQFFTSNSWESSNQNSYSTSQSTNPTNQSYQPNFVNSNGNINSNTYGNTNSGFQLVNNPNQSNIIGNTSNPIGVSNPSTNTNGISIPIGNTSGSTTVNPSVNSSNNPSQRNIYGVNSQIVSSFIENKVPTFFVSNRLTLPQAIFTHYENMKYKCFMGIFEDLERCWITIDNKFFVWYV